MNLVVPSAVREFTQRLCRNRDVIPQHIKVVIVREIEKLALMKSDECSLQCQYLEWMTTLPWETYSEENCDVVSAGKILDEDHYGLSNVKQRVFEHIACTKLGGTSQGKVICLVGPPGVGKTSIARSIARALHRNFVQLHVGGISKAPLIKGSPWTISPNPGKMVECIKSVGTFNPVILIDEIDTLGRSIPGDTLNALLELLDPELNANFLDHYLNVTIDLSKVLFICTANSLDNVPSPLANRMELIPVFGYRFDEKMRIARDHLEKTARIGRGFKPEEVDLSDAALHSLIEAYCIEPGVKNLQKHIEKIYRKSAVKRVRDDASDTTIVGTTKKVLVDDSDLVDYVGNPLFVAVKIGKNISKIYEQTPVGVAASLSIKFMVYIETSVIAEDKGKGSLDVITGQLGNVMKESVLIAYTFARSFLLGKEPKNLFFVNSKLHINGLSNIANEGLAINSVTTTLDGPSAGCTVITSLLSLAMKKPVRKGLAMTGAVTLTGRIHSIGGVMEKTLAARRGQVKTIIFPVENRRAFDELPQTMKEGLDVHFVDLYEQIYEIAFNYAQ